MKKRTKQRLALTGVIFIIVLFILTIVFLIMGNGPLAITTVGVNGFISVVLYFSMRFYGHDQEDLAAFNEAINDEENQQ